jgi:hypothetical protein
VVGKVLLLLLFSFFVLTRDDDVQQCYGIVHGFSLEGRRAIYYMINLL